MPRLRVHRLPPGTHELLLNLTHRHVHAQLVDRAAGRVILAVHSNEPVR
jgi:ribosomal protein L18